MRGHFRPLLVAAIWSAAVCSAGGFLWRAPLTRVTAAPAFVEEPSSPQTVGRRAAIRPISSIEGKDLYHAYCEQCHGPGGKGDGPAAAGLKKTPPDLTQIAARNNGTFKRAAVADFISGERPGGVVRRDEKTAAPIFVYSDGTPSEMPVYGILFRLMWQDQPPSIRCNNLARYIESIQAK